MSIQTLPIFTWQEKEYFIDARLACIRNIRNPRDYVDFSELPDPVFCRVLEALND